MTQIRGGCARQRVTALCAFIVALWAAPAAAQFGVGACTPTAKNVFVRDTMTDIYLWYQQLPNVDPARYDSPEAYLEAVRYQPLDSSFSYIADRAATEALFSSSEYAGFGFSSAFGPAGDLRIAQVFPGSPADEAGLARGDEIIEINGRSVAGRGAHGRVWRHLRRADGRRAGRAGGGAGGRTAARVDGEAGRRDPHGIRTPRSSTSAAGASATSSSATSSSRRSRPWPRRSRRCRPAAPPKWCSTCATTAAAWWTWRSTSPA